MRIAGALTGLVGGIVAVASAATGLIITAQEPLYHGRIGFGVAALLLAIIAGASGMIPRLPAYAASGLMGLCGALGFLATLPWYINTAYIAALPFWLIGALLLLLSGQRQDALGRA